jgi:hypothetical protein
MLLSLHSITNIIYDMLKTLERKFQDIAGTSSMPKSDNNNYSFSVQKKSLVTSHVIIKYITFLKYTYTTNIMNELSVQSASLSLP